MTIYLLMGASAAFAATPVIPLYQATYSVARNDLRIGSAEFSLTRNDNGIYTYQSVTRASGFLSVFVHNVITETSYFAVANGLPRSLQYSYQDQGSSHDRSELIRFDWNKGIAESKHDNETKALTLKTGTFDRLLAQLLISLDAASGHMNDDFTVLDHGELQTYRLREVTKATITTAAGEFATVEVARKDENKNRTTSFWLAPKLNYLPVQMQQTEPGKATISLVLTNIQFDSNPK